jgi:hypothetical protein
MATTRVIGTGAGEQETPDLRVVAGGKGAREAAAEPVKDKLTGKQSKFVQGILKGLSQSDAYRAAYDCANMADNSIWREASVLMTNPKVAQRLKTLQARQDDAALLSGLATRQHIQRTLYGLTTGGENDAAKLRACELLGKLSDVAAFTERVEQVTYDHLSEEELVAEIEVKLRSLFEETG